MIAIDEKGETLLHEWVGTNLFLFAADIHLIIIAYWQSQGRYI